MSTMTLTTSTATTVAKSARTTSSPVCKAVKVPSLGLMKPGYRAVCDSCGYHSYRYDQKVTADLVADTHEKTNCFRRAV